MIVGIEPFYQEIAKSIEDAVPEEWTSAKMEAIFYPDSSTYFGEYVRKADGKLRDFGTTGLGERAFREIRKKFKDVGKKPWGRAAFELFPDGRFNMEFGYDSCDRNGDTLFNEDEEVRRLKERHRRLSGSSEF